MNIAMSNAAYRAPFFLRSVFLGGHLQTVAPHLFRKVRGVAYERCRVLTPDRDFLDLDWLCRGSDRAAILTHGLEGSSRSSYMLGMARALSAAGWDVLAWNMRSCSGELNRLPSWYHPGLSDDLSLVFSQALFKKRYREISLIGFSLGGALTLNFLGEQGQEVAPLIKRAVAISTPCDLKASAEALARPINRIYMRRFLRSMSSKIEEKAALYPEIYKRLSFDGVRTFYDFDNRFTAPLHGFKDAEDYWRRCSPSRVLSGIKVPTLIINAANDPFLGARAVPALEQAPCVRLELTPHGGHLGFLRLGGRYWSELRALEFLSAPEEEEQPQISRAA